eukprot:1101646-Rhodomonas_salina.1
MSKAKHVIGGSSPFRLCLQQHMLGQHRTSHPLHVAAEGTLGHRASHTGHECGSYLAAQTQPPPSTRSAR